jgi:hypothetical protein
MVTCEGRWIGAIVAEIVTVWMVRDAVEAWAPHPRPLSLRERGERRERGNVNGGERHVGS